MILRPFTLPCPRSCVFQPKKNADCRLHPSGVCFPNLELLKNLDWGKQFQQLPDKSACFLEVEVCMVHSGRLVPSLEALNCARIPVPRSAHKETTRLE
jgi:hypothetical protein